jgi:3-oxoacyl-[acyl-carrier-protein] synthase III
MKIEPERVCHDLEPNGTLRRLHSIAPDRIDRTGRVVTGDYVLFVAFGAGLTWHPH